MNHLGFALLVFIFASTSWSQSAGIRWSEGEHLELGIEGTLMACKSLGIPAQKCPNLRIHRNDKKYTFQYGEVLTSADYYNNPTEFIQDTKSSVVKILKCAYKQKGAHAKQRNSDIDYPDCSGTGLFSIPGYLEVVSQNYNHFGWNNMVAYVDYHGQALQFAKQSFDAKENDPQQSKFLLNKALVYNAYADHYLTDAFASGHIRVPRTQIKEWARDTLPGTLRSSRGDLLSMFLHNTESINLRTRKEEGLRVQNAHGDVWLTRGDGHLNFFANEQDLGLMLPRLAVAESFKELLIAAMYGELPDGIYQAAHYVPFQSDMPLVQKLSPQHQQVKKHSDVVWLLFLSAPMSDKFIFFKSDFTRMLDSLSNIFVQFRRDVARDQRQNSELRKRLPNKYLQAYLDVE